MGNGAYSGVGGGGGIGGGAAVNGGGGAGYDKTTPLDRSHMRDNSEIVLAIMAAIRYYEQFPYRPRPKEMFNNLRIVLELENWEPGGGTNEYYDWLKRLDEEHESHDAD